MKLWFLRDPYSVEGLKYRISKLPDCAYKVCLELAVVQLENKVVSKEEVKKAIEYFRTGNRELLMVGFKILKLTEEQIDEALHLLKTERIK